MPIKARAAPMGWLIFSGLTVQAFLEISTRAMPTSRSLNGGDSSRFISRKHAAAGTSVRFMRSSIAAMRGPQAPQRLAAWVRAVTSSTLVKFSARIASSMVPASMPLQLQMRLARGLSRTFGIGSERGLIFRDRFAGKLSQLIRPKELACAPAPTPGSRPPC